LLVTWLPSPLTQNATRATCVYVERGNLSKEGYNSTLQPWVLKSVSKDKNKIMSVHDTKSLGSLKATHMGKNLSAQNFVKLPSLLSYSFVSAAGLLFFLKMVSRSALTK